MSRMRNAFALMVLLATVSAVGLAQSITVEHELGTAIVPAGPQRVVVFDFGALDTMDALGIEPVGLPKGGTIPSYLSKYRDAKYTNVGSLTEPNLEAVYSLRPDLIIISGRQQTYYEELSQIAPTIYVALDTTDYMESFKANARLLGRIFGREDEVEEHLAAVERSVAEVQQKVKAAGYTALVVLVNDKSVSAFGPGSRFGLIHDEFGFAPAREGIVASSHGQTISFEFILAANPDYLFVVDRGAVVAGTPTARQVMDNQLVRFTKAYQQGNIVYLDPEYWYLSGGGLLSVPAMVQEIASAL